MKSKSDWKSLVNATLGQTPLKCETKVFIDGTAYFSELAKEIKSTFVKNKKYFIYIMAWMLDVNFPLNKKKETLLDLLTIADSFDVEIRVLVNENPFYYKMNHETIKTINALKGRAFAIIDGHTFSSLKSQISLKQIKNKVSPLLRILEEANLEKVIPDLKNIIPIREIKNIKSVGTHHDKVVIISGPNSLRAFCGGMDINKNRISSQHDVQCRVENSAADQILNRFLNRWNALRKASPSNILLQAIQLRGKNITIIPTSKESKAPYVCAIGTYNTPNIKNKNHLKIKDRSAENMILAAIKNATKYVYIEDQYMTSLTIAKALYNSLLAGLEKVIILTQLSAHSKADILFPNRKRREFIETLIYGRTINKQTSTVTSTLKSPHAAKVKVYQMAASPGKSWHEIVHSKLYLIDDEVLIIGSFNCNERSMKHDSESGVIIINSESKSRKPSFVGNFRTSLWIHHYKPEVPFFEGAYFVPDMLNPFLWNSTSYAIDDYGPSGEDMDITLNKLLYEAKLKLYKLETQVSLSIVDRIIGNKDSLGISLIKEIETLMRHISSKSFRDFAWDIVDPHD